MIVNPRYFKLAIPLALSIITLYGILNYLAAKGEELAANQEQAISEWAGKDPERKAAEFEFRLCLDLNLLSKKILECAADKGELVEELSNVYFNEAKKLFDS